MKTDGETIIRSRKLKFLAASAVRIINR